MYLYILVSLVLALIFACSCHTAIRRHPGIFYGIAFFIILSEVIYYQFGIHDIAPQWFTAYIVNLFKRGAFSTALFIMHKKGARSNAGALLLFFPLYKTDFNSGYFSAVPPPWWPSPPGWDLTWVWRW